MPVITNLHGGSPGSNRPQSVFLPMRGAFVHASTDPTFKDNSGWSTTDRVVSWPPATDPFGPHREGVIHSARHVEDDPQGFVHDGLVFSATMRNRVAANPHTVSRYSRTASTPSARKK